MKLYKYCPMNQNTWETIRTGKFYFADWKKLNDPMEGIFRYKKDSIDLAKIVRQEKQRYRVCCLSKKCNEPLMWAHYADGFKGVCIEIDPNPNLNEEGERQIGEYSLVLKKDSDPTKLLTRKLDFWGYEDEWRILRRFQGDDEINLFEIGKIESVYYFSGGLLRSNSLSKIDYREIFLKKLEFKDLEPKCIEVKNQKEGLSR